MRRKATVAVLLVAIVFAVAWRFGGYVTVPTTAAGQVRLVEQASLTRTHLGDGSLAATNWRRTVGVTVSSDSPLNLTDLPTLLPADGWDAHVDVGWHLYSPFHWTWVASWPVAAEQMTLEVLAAGECPQVEASLAGVSAMSPNGPVAMQDIPLLTAELFGCAFD